MSAVEQKAAMIYEKHGGIDVSSIPIPKPGKDEVLVQIYAAALNPVDWKIQRFDIFVDKFPNVLGTDLAGEVVELGEGVENFAVGERVFCQGVYNEIEHTGFQQYATADIHTLGKIPANISYNEASTIPVAMSVSYLGMYNVHPFGLGLDTPLKPSARGKYTKTPIVIFGGSTSVGQFVIQLAKMSGFSPIITTSSLKHTDFIKSFGATHVIDRNQPWSKALVEAITDKPITLVYDAVSSGPTQTAGIDLLSPGGKLVTVLSIEKSVQDRADKENKLVSNAVAVKTYPHTASLMREFFSAVEKLLEDGDVKPNRVEILPSGLHGVAEGLKRLEDDMVSGIKLVARPQETK